MKKLTNKEILNNDFDQPDMAEQKYKENIGKKTKSEPVLKPKLGESFTERTKLRKQRLDEIAKKEKMINNNLFKEYFEYQSPSDMYKNLNTTTDVEKNETKVNEIKTNLANLMADIENNPTNIGNKLETEIIW